MSKEKRAVVTGGAGFIGSHLADRLLESGYAVLVVDNLTTGLAENVNPRAEFEERDITAEGLEGVLRAFRPELVFHLAAQANVRVSVENPLYDTSVNAHGTLRVLEACRAAGARKLVFSSTGGAIYGEPRSIPCDEAHPCEPLCIYGANKLTAEHYIRVYGLSYGLGYTILRFANIFGPRQNPKGEAGVVAIFAEQMLSGRQCTIFGDGSKTRDYVHVDDAVAALVLAARGGDGRLYNLGRGVQTTDQEVFDTVAAACGYTQEPIYGEVRPGEVIHIALDASLLRRELGWKPHHDFSRGVKQTVPFYRKKLGLA